MVTTHHAVLTAVGADRPGLVDEVARYVLERGGNLEDSRMVNLHGQFAMMLLVAGPDDVIGRLRDGLGALRRDSHVRAELQAADLAQGAASPPPSRIASTPGPWTTPAWSSPWRTCSAVWGSTSRAPTRRCGRPPTPTRRSSRWSSSWPCRPTCTSPTCARHWARLCDELNIDWQLTAL